MIPILLASAITAIPTISYEENINKQCSYVVGIPYASDNFTDEEWKRFQYCKKMMMQKG